MNIEYYYHVQKSLLPQESKLSGGDVTEIKARLEFLPDGTRLKKPFEAIITNNAQGEYSADIPVLCLWCPAFGATAEEALEDLADTVQSILYSIEGKSNLGEYTLAQQEILQAHI